MPPALRLSCMCTAHVCAHGCTHATRSAELQAPLRHHVTAGSRYGTVWAPVAVTHSQPRGTPHGIRHPRKKGNQTATHVFRCRLHLAPVSAAPNTAAQHCKSGCIMATCGTQMPQPEVSRGPTKATAAPCTTAGSAGTATLLHNSHGPHTCSAAGCLCRQGPCCCHWSDPLVHQHAMALAAGTGALHHQHHTAFTRLPHSG